MPQQKPGRSRQCYATPWDFVRAVERQFGKLDFDLAASPKNTKADRFYIRKQNALRLPWPNDLNLWLNPPYKDIGAWASKCEHVARGLKPSGSILLLVPASVCSNWFVRHVWRKSAVYLLAPRLCFIGKNEPYPKDLILCVYRRRIPAAEKQFFYWHWRKEILANQKGEIYGIRKAA